MGSGIQFQLMSAGFPRPPSNSEAPAGCPEIQLNAFTIYLEIASDS